MMNFSETVDKHKDNFVQSIAPFARLYPDTLERLAETYIEDNVDYETEDEFRGYLRALVNHSLIGEHTITAKAIEAGAITADRLYFNEKLAYNSDFEPWHRKVPMNNRSLRANRKRASSGLDSFVDKIDRMWQDTTIPQRYFSDQAAGYEAYDFDKSVSTAIDDFKAQTGEEIDYDEAMEAMKKKYTSSRHSKAASELDMQVSSVVDAFGSKAIRSWLEGEYNSDLEEMLGLIEEEDPRLGANVVDELTVRYASKQASDLSSFFQNNTSEVDIVDRLEEEYGDDVKRWSIGEDDGMPYPAELEDAIDSINKYSPNMDTASRVKGEIFNRYPRKASRQAHRAHSRRRQAALKRARARQAAIRRRAGILEDFVLDGDWIEDIYKEEGSSMDNMVEYLKEDIARYDAEGLSNGRAQRGSDIGWWKSIDYDQDVEQGDVDYMNELRKAVKNYKPSSRKANMDNSPAIRRQALRKRSYEPRYPEKFREYWDYNEDSGNWQNASGWTADEDDNGYLSLRNRNGVQNAYTHRPQGMGPHPKEQWQDSLVGAQDMYQAGNYKSWPALRPPAFVKKQEENRRSNARRATARRAAIRRASARKKIADYAGDIAATYAEFDKYGPNTTFADLPPHIQDLLEDENRFEEVKSTFDDSDPYWTDRGLMNNFGYDPDLASAAFDLREVLLRTQGKSSDVNEVTRKAIPDHMASVSFKQANNKVSGYDFSSDDFYNRLEKITDKGNVGDFSEWAIRNSSGQTASGTDPNMFTMFDNALNDLADDLGLDDNDYETLFDKAQEFGVDYISDIFENPGLRNELDPELEDFFEEYRESDVRFSSAKNRKAPMNNRRQTLASRKREVQMDRAILAMTKAASALEAITKKIAMGENEPGSTVVEDGKDADTPKMDTLPKEDFPKQPATEDEAKAEEVDSSPTVDTVAVSSRRPIKMASSSTDSELTLF